MSPSSSSLLKISVFGLLEVHQKHIYELIKSQLLHKLWKKIVI